MENKKYINPNILDEGNQMEILQDNEDEMLKIVRCNNCGKLTPFGMTYMVCGFVGCDNKVEVNGKEVDCYWEDLKPRVERLHNTQNNEDRKLYISGKVYRWRDGVS